MTGRVSTDTITSALLEYPLQLIGADLALTPAFPVTASNRILKVFDPAVCLWAFRAVSLRVTIASPGAGSSPLRPDHREAVRRSFSGNVCYAPALPPLHTRRQCSYLCMCYVMFVKAKRKDRRKAKEKTRKEIRREETPMSTPGIM